MVPAAVQAPYARGQDAAQRQVQTQAERDLAALALARRKGIMLAQLDAVADDDRLAEESRPVIEWFRDEVKAARSEARLEELAELYPQAGIRRRRRWQGAPAALESLPDDGWEQDDEEDQDDEQTSSGADGRRLAIVAAPGATAGVDFAAELAAREWVFRPHGTGICQLVHLKPHGWDYLPPQECIDRAVHTIPGGRVCDSCYQALTFSHRAQSPITPPREMTVAEALAAYGWQLSPAPGGCQVAEDGRVCGGQARHPIAGPHGQDAWICTAHNHALCKLIAGARRPA